VTRRAIQSGQASTSMMIGLGLISVAGLAGIVYLTLGSGGTSLPQQSNPVSLSDTQVPGEEQLNTTNEQVVDEPRANLSSGPEPDAKAEQMDWNEQFLVLLGENHLPSRKSIATPNVTLYEVDPNYVPVGGFSNQKTDTICGMKKIETVEEGMSVASVAIAAEDTSAMVGANAPDITGERPNYCPQDLGQVWGAGSYVFDKDYNQLAGQDFSESARILKSAYLWFEESYEREHGEPEDDEVIVILEGGAERSGDPAIRIANYDRAIIIDYPVLKREGHDPDDLVQGPGKTYAPPAPELPVTVTYQALFPSDYDPNALQVPIDLLEDRLADKASDINRQTDALDEVLIVTRNIRAANEAEGLERARRLQDVFKRVHGSDVLIRTVSFGDEAPICSDSSDECWSLNRATIAYFYTR